MNEKLKNIADVNNVATGYEYWRKYFRDKIYSRVVWLNMPETLPSVEVMNRVINHGYCGVFNHKKYGVVCCHGGLSGVDIYSHPTTFTYAQPILGSDRLTIGKDCAIITGTKEFWFTRYRIQDLINRYARLMADVDSSLDIAVVNSRMQNIFTGIDTQTVENVKTVVEAIRNGAFDVAVAPTMIETIKSIPFNNGLNASTLNDMLTLKDNIIKAFWSEIGVNYVARKTERYTSSEIGANNGLLVSNNVALITSLKEGVDRVNAVLGTDIKVELLPTETNNDNGGNENEEIYQR